MNLDYVFDDIEARAFFLGTKQEQEIKNIAEVIQVVFKAESIPDLYLYQPILASDYLAGFKSKSQSWAIIPILQIMTIQLPNLNSSMLQARSDLGELMDESLVSKDLKLSFLGNVPDVKGKLLNRRMSIIELYSENRLLLIPFENVAMITVENISELL